jgi:hypothetical protein
MRASSALRDSSRSRRQYQTTTAAVMSGNIAGTKTYGDRSFDDAWTRAIVQADQVNVPKPPRTRPAAGATRRPTRRHASRTISTAGAKLTEIAIAMLMPRNRGSSACNGLVCQTNGRTGNTRPGSSAKMNTIR